MERPEILQGETINGCCKAPRRRGRHLGRRLLLGRLGHRRIREGDGTAQHELCGRLGPVADLRRQVPAERERRANMVELRKVSSYQQGTFIEKGGSATCRERPSEFVGRASLRQHAKHFEMTVAQNRTGGRRGARRTGGENRLRRRRHGTDVSQPEPQLRRDPARGPLLGPRHRNGMVVLRHRGRVEAGGSRDGSRRGRHAGRVRMRVANRIWAAASRAYRAGARAPTSSAPRTSEAHAHARQDLDVQQNHPGSMASIACCPPATTA